MALVPYVVEQTGAGERSMDIYSRLQELSKYMGGKVNLVLQGRSTNVDKQKATAAMQEFFTENKVSGFNVNHQGKRDESSFVIGTLATTNGNFRVNCFLKKVQNQYLIHQIRIDKINE